MCSFERWSGFVEGRTSLLYGVAAGYIFADSMIVVRIESVAVVLVGAETVELGLVADRRRRKGLQALHFALRADYKANSVAVDVVAAIEKG